jgi:hypothetical protein
VRVQVFTGTGTGTAKSTHRLPVLHTRCNQCVRGFVTKFLRYWLPKDLQGKCTKCTFDKHACSLVDLIVAGPLVKKGKEKKWLKVVEQVSSLCLELQPVSKLHTPSEGGGGHGHKRTWAHHGKSIVQCSINSANFSFCRNCALAVYWAVKGLHCQGWQVQWFCSHESGHCTPGCHSPS